MEKFEFDQAPYKKSIEDIQIHDDYFDDRFILEVDKITDRIGYNLTNIANRYTYPYKEKGSHKLLGATLFSRKDEYNISNTSPPEILNLYKHTINQILKDPKGNTGVNVELMTISINVQPMGQDGTPHRDGMLSAGDRTLMYFANSKWEKKWGGPFQILDPDTKEVLNEIDYVPGRLIYFDGGLLHRGLAPKNVPYVYRKSIVYRIKTR